MNPSDKSDEQVEILLGDMLEVYGYDFSGYSRASLKRRIMRLYVLDSFVSFAEFRYKLRTDAGYFKRFLEQITINVTEMFRDPDFYKNLRNEVLPKLGTYPFIRIWIAGCSTGEEAFSVAIVLKELGLLKKSLIYATDINEKVLEKAALGIIPLNKMQQYSENYIAGGGDRNFSDYYSANYSVARLNDEIKSPIVFATHNLVCDNSFNEFQLILCRNVMIYFDRSLQTKVFGLFDDSLENLGYLGLGSKESLDFSGIGKKYKRLNSEKIWRKISA